MKNINNTYLYDIAAIILAYLRDEVDEEGLRELNVWLEESDSHKALFARIQDEKMQYEDIQKILSYDAGGAWQVVQQKAAWRRRKRLTSCSFCRDYFWSGNCFLVERRGDYCGSGCQGGRDYPGAFHG